MLALGTGHCLPILEAHSISLFFLSYQERIVTLTQKPTLKYLIIIVGAAIQ